jgi:hypothetical protein
MKESELYSGVGYISDLPNLDEILNLEPKKEWIKEHPQVKGFMYLPIERVEFLLNRLYKNPQIEIRSVISTDTRAVVTVRVNYINRDGEKMYQDGIGAVNVNKGQPAEMSFPMAKTLAIKDACDMFGKIFGKDLNRKEVSVPSNHKELSESQSEAIQSISKSLAKCSTVDELNSLWMEILVYMDKDITKTVKAMFTKRKVEING